MITIDGKPIKLQIWDTVLPSLRRNAGTRTRTLHHECIHSYEAPMALQSRSAAPFVSLTRRHGSLRTPFCGYAGRAPTAARDAG